MDPAQEIEQHLLARHGPINEAIDRGDSPIQQFYKGTTVFLTGGSGFLGKQLVEKLFRSCEIKKLYMLLRSKKEYPVEQRLSYILKDSVFDLLRKKQPQFAEKIVPVEGDVEKIRLGITEKEWSVLTEEVNVIFHMAATVNFTEPIRKATLINVRGTREALTLGKQCKHFKFFNYTSTAFAHATKSRINTDIEETFYPSPVPPDVMIEMVETVDESRLNAITSSLLNDWPNTYTFTKALAEELIKNTAGDLPACIIKPPIVINSYIEPAPGWIDLKACLTSLAGSIAGASLGILHVLLLDTDKIINYAPLDLVNNAVIAASWDAFEKKNQSNKYVPIYTISINTKWSTYTDTCTNGAVKRFPTPKAVWYPCCIKTSSKLVYWVMMWLFHYIPGYFIDVVLDLLKVRPKGLPSFVTNYSKFYKLSLVHDYFACNNFNIKGTNVNYMLKRMSPHDRVIFNCELKASDLTEHLVACFIGLRRFIIKDGLQGTVDANRKHKYLFRYLNMIFLAAYGYFIDISIAGASLGILHVLLLDTDKIINYAPLDLVNNAVIAASWDAFEKKNQSNKDVPIYTISINTKWSTYTDTVTNGAVKRFPTPKAVWYPCCIKTSSKLVYWVMMWLFHYIPGYFIDVVLDLLKVRPKGLPSFVTNYSKFYKLSLVHDYFACNNFNIKGTNVNYMLKRMSPHDRVIFNCELKASDLTEHLVACFIGLRRFIIKDGLQGTVDANRKHKYLFRYLNMIFLAAYGYFIDIVLYKLYAFSISILQLLF